MATYCIEHIEGLKRTEHRAVVVLVSKGDDDVDAAETFEELEMRRERELRTRFETWIDGVHHNNQWFHGFDRAPYRECFVFKWKEKRQHHRLYGFLCHPRPRTNKRFQVCVLTNHATKSQHETDPSELNKAESLRTNSYVRVALEMVFPDEEPGTKRCLN